MADLYESRVLAGAVGRVLPLKSDENGPVRQLNLVLNGFTELRQTFSRPGRAVQRTRNSAKARQAPVPEIASRSGIDAARIRPPQI